MNKHELFVVSHYLSSWVEDWSFKKIIEELEDGNPREIIDIYCLYDNLNWDELAQNMQNMLYELKANFK